MAANRITKIDDEDFEYRGVLCRRDDAIRGYDGHYSTVTGYHNTTSRFRGIRTQTRRELLRRIDGVLDYQPPTDADLMAALGPCGK